MGDTVIENDTAIILEEKSVSSDNTISSKHIYMKYDSNSVFYYHGEDNDFKLIYDFNAEKGDTIKIFCRQATYSDENDLYVFIRVDSVSQMTVRADTLKI